jgi:hypothetical protein
MGLQREMSRMFMPRLIATTLVIAMFPALVVIALQAVMAILPTLVLFSILTLVAMLVVLVAVRFRRPPGRH